MALIDSGKEFDKEKNHEKLKKRMENMTNIQYTLRIPKAMYKEIKHQLVQDEKTLREVLLEALKVYIKK